MKLKKKKKILKAKKNIITEILHKNNKTFSKFSGNFFLFFFFWRRKKTEASRNFVPLSFSKNMRTCLSGNCLSIHGVWSGGVSTISLFIFLYKIWFKNLRGDRAINPLVLLPSLTQRHLELNLTYTCWRDFFPNMYNMWESSCGLTTQFGFSIRTRDLLSFEFYLK